MGLTWCTKWAAPYQRFLWLVKETQWGPQLRELFHVLKESAIVIRNQHSRLVSQGQIFAFIVHVQSNIASQSAFYISLDVPILGVLWRTKTHSDSGQAVMISLLKLITIMSFMFKGEI